MREGLVDAEGNLLGLAGVVSHLYYTEPSNFLFGSLFRSGVFDTIANDKKMPKQDKMEKVVSVLSNLFNKVYLHRGLKKGQTIIKSPSKVFLDELDEDVKQVVRNYNRRTLEVYSQYISFYATYTDLGPDNALPASNLSFPTLTNDNKNSNSNTNTTPTLLDTLQKESIIYKARSPFIATSGLGDNFTSLNDLVGSPRRGIYLDGSGVPITEDVDWKGESLNLNAYLLDFFKVILSLFLLN